MKLELKDEKGFTGLFIELPLEKLKEELGLGNASSEIAAHLKLARATLTHELIK